MENAELLHPLVAEAVERFNLQARVMACDPALADTAAFCEFYKFRPEQTCNAILAAGKTEPIKFACCLILSSCKLDVNKVVCRLLEIKKCSFASAEQTIQMTQMEIGGVTPVGVSAMPIFVDERVMDNDLVVLGGGNRSSKLLLNPAELKKIAGLEVVNSLAIPRG